MPMIIIAIAAGAGLYVAADRAGKGLGDGLKYGSIAAGAVAGGYLAWKHLR